MTTTPLRSSSSSTALKSFNDIPGPSYAKLLSVNRRFRDERMANPQASVTFPLFQWCWEEYGDVVKVKVPFKDPLVVCYQPNDVEAFLRASGPRPVRPGFLALGIKQDRASSARGLITSAGEEWHRIRTKVQQPMLRPKAARGYASRLEDVADDFVERAVGGRSGGGGDFLNDLHRWALESVGAIAFDARLGCLDRNLDESSEQAELIRAVQDLMIKSDHLENGMSLWTWLPSASETFRQFGDAYDAFKRISTKYVGQAMAAEDRGRGSVLGQLLERGCDEDEAMAMVLDMVFAGIDTSAHAVGFVLYCLAKNPEVQRRLHHEVRKFRRLDDADDDATPYLRAVVKEGLRLYPPAAMSARSIDGGVVDVGGYRVDTKAMFVGAHLWMARSDRFFTDPLEFRPERWLRGGGDDDDDRVHPFTVLPFGHGPRMCVGRRLAELESKILLCKIVRRFEVGWPEVEDQLGFVVETLLKPSAPLNFVFRRRDGVE